MPHSLLNPKGTEISIRGASFTIDPMPLGRYADFLDGLDEIPRQFEGLQDFKEAEIIKVLPKIIRNSLPELLTLTNVATQIPKETLEKASLIDLIRLFSAVYQENELEEVVKSLKGFFAFVRDLDKMPQQAAPIGSPTLSSSSPSPSDGQNETSSKESDQEKPDIISKKSEIESA